MMRHKWKTVTRRRGRPVEKPSSNDVARGETSEGANVAESSVYVQLETGFSRKFMVSNEMQKIPSVTQLLADLLKLFG